MSKHKDSSVAATEAVGPGDALAMAEEKIGEAVARRFPEPRFDPTIIITIITAILSLLGNCPNNRMRPSTLRRQRAGQNLRSAQLATKIRRESGVNVRDAVELAEAAYDAADGSSDQELQSFIDQCCR